MSDTAREPEVIRSPVLRVTPPIWRAARRPHRLMERAVMVYRRTPMILLSGFFERRSQIAFLANVALRDDLIANNCPHPVDYFRMDRRTQKGKAEGQ